VTADLVTLTDSKYAPVVGVPHLTVTRTWPRERPGGKVNQHRIEPTPGQWCPLQR